MIRQLTKTNILLGGQLEWRFILGYADGSLCVKDLFLGPVSKNIIYNNSTEYSALLHPHSDNIKALYDKIKGDFFSIKQNPTLKTKYPIHVDNLQQSLKTDTMDQQYEMGVERELVSKYGKQHSFLCPFWADSIDDFKNGLRFTFETKSAESTPIFNVLQIDEDHNNDIYNYIMEYVNRINLNKDLIVIDFEKHIATLCGIDCNSGDEITKNIDNLERNLISRERPMLEQCNLIMRCFSDNNIICKQLFNFRFFFDLGDMVIDLALQKNLYLKPLSIAAKMYVGNKDYNVLNNNSNVELYDFFSNFEFLNKKRIIGINESELSHYEDENYSANSLEYLRDNECVDFIYENKINQQTIYWRLYDNENQLFNLYKGLNNDIYNEIDGDYVYIGNNDGMYDETPLLESTTDSIGYSAFKWISIVDCNNKSQLFNALCGDKISKNVWKSVYLDEYATKINIQETDDVIWNNYIKYNLEGDNKPTGLIGKTLYMCNLYYPALNKDKYICYQFDKDNAITIIICSNDLSHLSYKYFKDNILIDDDFVEQAEEYIEEYIEDIRKLVYDVVYPSKIRLQKSLYTKRIESPSNNSVEFKYVPNDNSNVILYRYGGDLYPMFIPINSDTYSNFQYNVKQFDDYYKLNDLNSSYIFTDMLNTKYAPTYPSIDFFSLEKITKINYLNADENDLYEKDECKIFEYKWYQDSKFQQIPNNIVVKYESIPMGEPDDIIEKFTKSLYGNTEDETIQFVKKYILKLYNRKVDFINKVVRDNKSLDILYDYTFTYTLK